MSKLYDVFLEYENLYGKKVGNKKIHFSYYSKEEQEMFKNLFKKTINGK